MIERLEGDKRRVLIDTYRHLKLAHLIGSEGKHGRGELDRDYPAEGIFSAMRAPGGGYAWALDSASDMIAANIALNPDLSDDVREILRSLLAELVDRGVLDAPNEDSPQRYRDFSRKDHERHWQLAPYRPASVRDLSPAPSYSVDPLSLEERSRDHEILQNEFARFLRARDIRPHKIEGVPVDLACLDQGVLVVIEVKTVNDMNQTRQLRLGLGQLLDYLDVLRAEETPTRGVLVLERRPKERRWEALLERHEVRLAWPGSFDRAFVRHGE